MHPGDMQMSRPIFCPNCGAKLPEGAHGAQPFVGTGLVGEDGWDCFCDACRWSGDILPDDEDATVVPLYHVV